MSDIRLYVYEAGTLRKNTPLKHKFNLLQDCLDAIENYQLKKHQNKTMTYQFVITEYTGTYQSKIINVITKHYTK